MKPILHEILDYRCARTKLGPAPTEITLSAEQEARLREWTDEVDQGTRQIAWLEPGESLTEVVFGQRRIFGMRF